MSPRGRHEATPEEARAWFDEVRNGRSMAAIAKDAGRDARTVKRAVQFYTASLESREVRRDSLRAALEKHYGELLAVLGEAGARAVSGDIPSFDRIPLGRTRPRMLRPYCFAIDWKYRHAASAHYWQEGTPTWAMLGSHLGREPVWTRYRTWRDAGSDLVGQMLLVFAKLQPGLKKATGLDLATGDGPGLVSGGIRVLFETVMAEAAGRKTALTRLLASLAADGRGIWIDRSRMLIQNPEAGEDLIRTTRAALREPELLDQVANLGERISRCREAGRGFAEEVAYMTAVPHLGGECRACARLAL